LGFISFIWFGVFLNYSNITLSINCFFEILLSIDHFNANFRNNSNMSLFMPVTYCAIPAIFKVDISERLLFFDAKMDKIDTIYR